MSEKTNISALAVHGDRFSRDFGIVTLRLATYACLTYAAYRFLKSEASTRIFEGSLARYFEEPRIICTTIAAFSLLGLETAIQRAGQREAFRRGKAAGSAETQAANQAELNAAADNLGQYMDALQALEKKVKQTVGSILKMKQPKGAGTAESQLAGLDQHLDGLCAEFLRILGQKNIPNASLHGLVEVVGKQFVSLRNGRKAAATGFGKLCQQIYAETTPKLKNDDQCINLISSGITKLKEMISEAKKETELVKRELRELQNQGDIIFNMDEVKK